jgi:hypothetical protein
MPGGGHSLSHTPESSSDDAQAFSIESALHSFSLLLNEVDESLSPDANEPEASTEGVPTPCDQEDYHHALRQSAFQPAGVLAKEEIEQVPVDGFNIITPDQLQKLVHGTASESFEVFVSPTSDQMERKRQVIKQLAKLPSKLRPVSAQMRQQLSWVQPAALKNADMPQWMSALASMHVELTPLNQPGPILQSVLRGTVDLSSWRARRDVLVAALRVLLTGLHFLQHLEVALYFMRAGDSLSRVTRTNPTEQLLLEVMGGINDSSCEDFSTMRLHLLGTCERLFGATDIFAVSLDTICCSGLASMSCCILDIIEKLGNKQAWRQTWVSPGMMPNRII